MTIKNIAPRKMIIGDLVSGYTKVYIPHSTYYDEDVVGKAFWINGNLYARDYNTQLTNTVLSNLEPNQEYTLTSSFYDAMVTDILLQRKISVNISDPKKFKTKKGISLDAINISAQDVDIGVGDPLLSFYISGEADYINIYAKAHNTSEEYVKVYSGANNNPITITFNPGTYDFRAEGVIALPDGITTDVSEPQENLGVEVSYSFPTPERPDNISYRVANIKDGIERYDLQVSWNWDKGSGSNVREFVLYFVDETEYNENKWNNANKINVGSARSTVIPSFPRDRKHYFKVVAVAWGPEDYNSSESSVSTFEIDENTPIDNSFTNDTDIEVTYDHIAAYRNNNGTKNQTFRVDAGTGAVSIGLLDNNGNAPISFDPTSGNVNVDGAVISSTIYSASFVMSNLSGQDNPHIRTSTKTNYGSPNQGMWAGFDGSDFKFDLGNSTQYLRWDGDSLVISGKVKIGTPSGQVDIEKGIQGNFVANVYKEAATKPSTPTGTAYPPSGWSTSPIASNDTVWISTAVIDSKTNTVADNSYWSEPIPFSAKSGEDGVGVVNVYKTSVNRPSNPTGDSISPSGWSSSPTNANPPESVWMSTAVRVANSSTIEGNWSTPVKITGNDGADGDKGDDGQTFYTWVKYADNINGGGLSNSPSGKSYIGIAYNKTSPTESNNPNDYVWSKYKGEDGVTYYTWIKYADDINGNGLSNSPNGKSYIGMAYNKLSSSESNDPRDYVWSKYKGEDGTPGRPGDNGRDGVRGPGLYSQPIPNLAEFMENEANDFFRANFSDGPVKYDVVTQYRLNNPTISFTKQWDGAEWVEPALVVHGDMVVDGTITTDKIVADQAFLQKMGVDVIYDNQALATGDPENNYSMKIDLEVGSIHIR